MKVSKSENFDYTHNICQVKESVNLLLESTAYSLQTKSSCYYARQVTLDMHPLLLFLQYSGYSERDTQGCGHAAGTRPGHTWAD